MTGSIYDVDDDVSQDYVPGAASSDEAEGNQAAESGGVDRQKARRVVRGGWANAQKQKDAASPFPSRLDLSEGPAVVKFLGDEGGAPYVSYRAHWINEIRQGNRQFTCLDDIDDRGCPLCDAGHRPSTRSHFNVALLSKDEEPALKSFEVGPTVFDQISSYHQNELTGPMDRYFWHIERKKGAGNRYTYTFIKQVASDLEEAGYSIDTSNVGPLWDESSLVVKSWEDLSAVAREFLDLE